MVVEGPASRKCCPTNEAQWHVSGCSVNGPTGPSCTCNGWPHARGIRECELTEAGIPRAIETDNLPPGPMVVGEFTHPGTEIVRSLAGLDYGYSAGVGDELHSTNVPGVFARNLVLVPYRGCCPSFVSRPHATDCRAHYFAEGQTVIQADQHWSFGSGRESLLRIKPDTVSSDRTFENETRLH